MHKALNMSQTYRGTTQRHKSFLLVNLKFRVHIKPSRSVDEYPIPHHHISVTLMIDLVKGGLKVYLSVPKNTQNTSGRGKKHKSIMQQLNIGKKLYYRNKTIKISFFFDMVREIQEKLILE